MGVFRKKWRRKLGKWSSWKKALGLDPRAYTEGNPLKNFEAAFKERHGLTHSPLQDPKVSQVVQGGLQVFGPIGMAVGAGLEYSRAYLDAQDAKELAREQAAGYTYSTYYGSSGMDQLYEAADLIALIEAQGGPSLEDADRFYSVRRAVDDALSRGDELGILPLLWLGGAGVVGFLGWVLYKQSKAITKAGGQVIRAGSLAVQRTSRVVLWAGAAWVLFQLYKRR